jgi:hypothetical protein
MDDYSTFWEQLTNVSKADMWHELSGDRLRLPRFLLFCQYLLPMGKYFQIIFLWTLETCDITETQITFSGIRSLSLSQPTESHRPFDQIPSFQISDGSVHSVRLQLDIDYFEKEAEFELDTQVLTHPWNCFQVSGILWNHIPSILSQGHSRFRRTTDCRANVAFLLPVIKLKS